MAKLGAITFEGLTGSSHPTDQPGTNSLQGRGGNDGGWGADSGARTRVADPQDAIVRRPISNTIDDRIGIQIAYSKVVFRLL